MADSRTGGTPRESTAGRLAALDGAFPAVVAELWRRAGWTVENSPGSDLAYVAHADDGRRRTRLCAVPPSDGPVTGATVRNLVERSGASASDVTAVSAREFTTGALDVADAHGVDAVGPVAVARLVDALDATDVLADPPTQPAPGL